MPLSPPYPVQERILLTGPYGTGKSTAWLTIARWALRTGSDARFYCVDTDDTVERLLWTEFTDVKDQNVEFKVCQEWEETKKAMFQFSSAARPQDWIVPDMVTPFWDQVQDWFSRSVYLHGRGEFFIEARKAMEEAKSKGRRTSDSAFEGMKDWPIIKGEYQDVLVHVLLKGKCNILATASIEDVSKFDEKNRQLMTVFGPRGVKPRGEKNTAHLFHSVLWTSAPLPGQVNLTTIKDRGRQVLEAMPFQDFCLQYLRDVAGWSLV